MKSATICSFCAMRERLAGLPQADREAIHLAANRGTLAGIKEIRRRLGWSIREAVDAVELLRVRVTGLPNSEHRLDDVERTCWGSGLPRKQPGTICRDRAGH